MAREKSPLLFSGSLEVEMQGPLDARRSVKRLTDLTDANSFPYIYKGLDVFCEETGKWYTFMGEDKTSMSNWREEGSGGGTVDQTYNSTSTNAQSGTAVAEAVASMGSDVLVVDLWHPYDEEASAETDYESEIYRSELSITPEEIIAASRSGKVVLLRDHYDGATPESPSPKYNPCLYTLVTAFDSWHHNDAPSGKYGYRLIFKEFNNNDYQASIIEANYYDGVSYRELTFVNTARLSSYIDTAIAKERESTLRDYFEGAEYAEEGRGKVTFTSPDRKVPWETDPTDSTVFEGTDYGVHMHAWEDLEYENPFTHIDAELTSKTYVAEKIAEAMTDVDNEHFHPVTALPDPADEDTTKRPKDNHEYILIEYEQDGTTIKSETHYLFYGGAYHQKSTGGISLDGYATTAYVNEQDASLSASISALQARIQTLEGKLADYTETRLKLSDGTTTVDKTILAKPYAAPTPPTQTMFDLPDGLYDAEGNLLFDLTDSEYVAYDMDVDRNKTYRSMDVGSLYDLYPTLCGVVLRCGSGDKYSDFEFYSENTETDGKLKWVVLASGDGDNQSFKDPIWAWQGLETVYYRGSLTVPVWDQSTTINTTGTPLAWA